MNGDASSAPSPRLAGVTPGSDSDWMRRSQRRSRWLVVAWLVVALALHGLRPPPFPQQRLDHLHEVAAALEAYRRDHGAYPVSQYSTAWTENRHQPDWIPGLVPRYLAALPEDPRASHEAAQQYLYVSDGKDYKLIAHGSEDFAFIARTQPLLVDPRRPTWAYGIWTKGAGQW